MIRARSTHYTTISVRNSAVIISQRAPLTTRTPSEMNQKKEGEGKMKMTSKAFQKALPKGIHTGHYPPHSTLEAAFSQRRPTGDLRKRGGERTTSFQPPSHDNQKRRRNIHIRDPTRKDANGQKNKEDSIVNSAEPRVSQTLAGHEDEETEQRGVDEQHPDQTHQGALVEELPETKGKNVSQTDSQQHHHRGIKDRRRTYLTNGSLIFVNVMNVYSLYPTSASTGSSTY